MQVAWLNDQQPLLSVFVADGAGSVSQGGEGAMLAVNEAMAYMSQKVQGGELGLNDVLATNMVLTIRQRLFAEAEAKGVAAKEVTPFLLQRIFEITAGRSLVANIALVLNNARLAAEIAKEIRKAEAV
jgi:hypothetical protein